MHKLELRKLAGDRLEIAEVRRDERQVVNQTACGGPHVVDATVFETTVEARVELCPLVNYSGRRRDHDTSADRFLETPRSRYTPFRACAERENLEFADD